MVILWLLPWPKYCNREITKTMVEESLQTTAQKKQKGLAGLSVGLGRSEVP